MAETGLQVLTFVLSTSVWYHDFENTDHLKVKSLWNVNCDNYLFIGNWFQSKSTII